MPESSAESTRRVLILGGTTEARALAGFLAASGDWWPVTALAGRTDGPRRPPGDLRTGGFGGPDGLAAYLADTGPVAVIDATHPFAARMGANAARACAVVGVPLLRLERSGWTADPDAGDRWTRVPDEAAAARAVAGAGSVFLALGRQALAPFAGLDETARVVVRSVDPLGPDTPLPCAVPIVARGPFDEADEAALLRDHGVTVLVCRDSGGADGRAKLMAARSLGVSVVMIDRPPRPKGVPAVHDGTAALAWLAGLAGLGSRRALAGPGPLAYHPRHDAGDGEQDG
ncbi:cobalt-precorrin-6A reductase [Roseospira navarrensis]|uniref:cobalt-precorrin-6A reductase n=1 Tax=Roseospira navarrensis TaxID=140058 RepID=UPI001FE7BEC7|nr:cobalt-precorrin-6A reductase [Roseospira navarrensis]